VPVNYTNEETQRLLELYSEWGNEGIEVVANQLNRSVKSVRAKLVREGTYIVPPKPLGKRKAEGLSKKELLRDLETIVPFKVDGFLGVTKTALRDLLSYLRTTD
jgi:hypothetical protein